MDIFPKLYAQSKMRNLLTLKPNSFAETLYFLCEPKQNPDLKLHFYHKGPLNSCFENTWYLISEGKRNTYKQTAKAS